MWKKGCSDPWGRVRGILNALNPKVTTTSNMFFEVTKVHMFPFVLTVSLKMTEAYFPIFGRLCGKRPAAINGEGSGAF